MIFVNFKTYKEASGEGSVSLARTISAVAEKTGVKIISCPQAIDLREVVAASNHPVWAQHADSVKRGRATGWLPFEIAKEAGAEGVLLNHSEHKLSVGELGESLARCKEIGLKSLVFADSPEEAKMLSKFEPDLIGYEPPELIASTDTSVARAKPDVIKKVVDEVDDGKVVVGAGVKDKKDVEVSLELGAVGVALASSVVKADNPKEVLTELAKGFRK